MQLNPIPGETPEQFAERYRRTVKAAGLPDPGPSLDELFRRKMAAMGHAASLPAGDQAGKNPGVSPR